MMRDFLELCGFGPDEIERQQSRIQEVFNRVGINNEDMIRAKDRLNTYYDMELQGVRKMLRFCILNFADLILAREEGKKKIIYGLMSPGAETMASALMMKSKEIYGANPSRNFCMVLGIIFGKLNPIFEAAEKLWLEAGAVSHCGNVKLYTGLLALGLIPKPDILVSSGFLCDTAPKTADLLQEVLGVPTYCYDTCKDMETMDDPHERQVMDLGVKSLKDLAKKLEDVVGLEITDKMLTEAKDAGRDFGAASLRLDTLLASSDPLPIGSTHQALYYRFGGTSYDVESMPNQVDAVNTLHDEVQERVSKGLGIMEKGAPRVFCTAPPHEADPRLEYLLDKMGIANIAAENRLFPPDGSRSPTRARPFDLYESLCMNLYTSMYQTPKARIPALIGFCKRIKIDGVLDRYHAGCRSAALDAMLIRSAIMKDLNIPVLLLDWENFDPRVYDQGAYEEKLDAFKAMMLQRRGRASRQ